MLHPEFKRRLLGLFDYAQAHGTDVGIGGGARSRNSQLSVFLQRHVQVTAGGCCVFKGHRYALKAGAAHAAPPDRSYHETEALDGFAVAADLVGDLAFVKKYAAQFGLVEFSGLKEPWHVQPTEVPRARSQYAGEKLRLWLVPVKRKTIQKGSVGVDVKVLKVALNVVNNAGLKNMTRVWGNGLERAVRDYQTRYGLPVNGLCCELMWESLYRVANLKGVAF